MDEICVISNKPNIIWIKSEAIEQRIDSGFYKTDPDKKINLDICMDKISNYCYLSKEKFSPKQYKKGSLKYIDISNVDINTGEYKYSVINIEDLPSRARKKINFGDIIVSTVRPNRNAVSLIDTDDDELVASTGFAVVKKKENIDQYFLFAVLKSNFVIEQLVKKIGGGLYPAINEQDVIEIDIPVPSHYIQVRIGDKIREVKKIWREIQSIDNEVKSLFDTLFDIQIDKSNVWWLETKYISDRIDCEYNYKYLNELREKFENLGYRVINFGELILNKMSEPQTDSKDFVSDGIPLLRITDIQEDYLDFDNCAKIPSEIYEELKDFQLIPGDIIFGLSGTVGRAIVVPEDIPDRAITNRRIAKVTLKNPKLSFFVAYFLNSKYGSIQIQREATGGVQKNLRLEDIDNILIPLPKDNYINFFLEKIRIRTECVNKARYLLKDAKREVESIIEGTNNVSQ